MQTKSTKQTSKQQPQPTQLTKRTIIKQIPNLKTRKVNNQPTKSN